MPDQGPGEPIKATGQQRGRKPPATLRPSSSILLLSPTNQVLLLHRVQTSTSFASAHVFPGGNLSSFHDAPLPDADGLEFHEDGTAYRLAAIRETFEESGILLAKKQGGSQDQELLHIPEGVREAGRKQIHGNQVKFTEWLKSLGGEPDVENLIPFTRWITPHGPPKRFTTQMYLYMLPLSQSPPAAKDLLETNQAIVPTPTHDGGVEHTAATFDDARAWLAKARAGGIILFPPQFYLLHLVSEFLHPSSFSTDHQTQRDALLTFLRGTSTSSAPDRDDNPAGTTGDSNSNSLKCATTPWSEKVISPSLLFARKSDNRLVLGLDKPGPELKGSGRAGDWERVVLVNFRREGPRDVEVKGREEVLREEREEKTREGGGSRL